MAKTKEELDEKLCDYCTLEKKGVYGVPGGFVAGCEGSGCDDAYEAYLFECEGKEPDASKNTLPIDSVSISVCECKNPVPYSRYSVMRNCCTLCNKTLATEC